MWENLGVTQMRAGLLDDASLSFKKARKLSPGLDAKNLAALQEHLDHRNSLAADAAVKQQAQPSPNFARIGTLSAEQEDAAAAAEEAAEEVEVVVELGQPLGVSLWPGLLVEAAASGGQLASAAGGDRVVAVAATRVWSVGQLQEELEALRAAGVTSVGVTLARSDKAVAPRAARPAAAAPLKRAGGEAALVKEAVAFVSTGDLASALPLFVEAAELSPQKAGLWANVGNCQRDLGLHTDALASYTRGLEIDPASSLLKGNLEKLHAVTEGGSDRGGGASSAHPHSKGEGFCDDGVSVNVRGIGGDGR
jgi:Tfp pilus assembly protein PilF